MGTVKNGISWKGAFEMFVIAILMGLAMMAVIAFGPVLSAVLNHLLLISVVAGSAGAVALAAYAVSRIRSAARESEPEVPALTTGPAYVRPLPA